MTKEEKRNIARRIRDVADNIDDGSTKLYISCDDENFDVSVKGDEYIFERLTAVFATCIRESLTDGSNEAVCAVAGAVLRSVCETYPELPSLLKGSKPSTQRKQGSRRNKRNRGRNIDIK